MAIVNTSTLIKKIRAFLNLPNFGIELTDKAGVNIGDGNTSSGTNSTVSGGLNNRATNGASVVSGGSNNDATGYASIVTGGDNNTADGDYSSCVGGKFGRANKYNQLSFGGVVPSAGSQFSVLQWYGYFPPSQNVTFQDTGDTVTLNAHGLSNGQTVSFTSITSTTGISINTTYYVINPTTNTFQLSSTLNGSILPLTTNGSGVLNPAFELFLGGDFLTPSRAFLNLSRMWYVKLSFVLRQGSNYVSGERAVTIRRPSSGSPVIVGSVQTLGTDIVSGITPFSAFNITADSITSSLKLELVLNTFSSSTRVKVVGLVTEMPT